MTAAPARDGRPRSRRLGGARAVAARIAATSAAALVLGGATSPAQQHLPAALTSSANSAGGWTLLTAALVLAMRAGVRLSAVLGALAFVLMVEGYRIVSEWRGFSYGEPFQDVFTLIGLLAGPVVGAGSALVRSPSPRLRALSTTPLCAVLIGEGVYGLTVVRGTTSPVWWIVQLVVGVAVLVAVLVVRPVGPAWSAVATATVLLGATAFWFAYQAL